MVPLVAGEVVRLVKLQPIGMVISNVMTISNVRVKLICKYFFKIRVYYINSIKIYKFCDLIIDFLCCPQEMAHFQKSLLEVCTIFSCGKLSGVVKLPSQSASRINAEDSDVYYPWVVVVRREDSKGDYQHGSECAGTIITET